MTLRESSAKQWLPAATQNGLLLLQAAIVFGLYIVVWRLAFYSARLDMESYLEPVILVQALQEGDFVFLIGASTALLASAFRRVTWDSIDPSGRTRILILVIAGILVWTYTTYDYNLFYDRSHAVDRLILIGLWCLTILHPIFVPSLLGAVLLVASQIQYPLSMANWYWADKRLVIDTLILFWAFLLVRGFLGRKTLSSLFPYVALCLVGLTYLTAALSKMSLGPDPWSWVLENHLSNLFVSAHMQGGWLAFLREEQVLALAGWLRVISIPLALLTLCIEMSGVLLLLRRDVARILLCGFLVLHGGILLTSGIFFWKWMILDAALIWFLSPGKGNSGSAKSARQGPFGLWSFGMAIIFMIFLPRVSYPERFAWYDSPMTNFFVFEGVGPTGRTYTLHPRFFAPYDLLLQQSRFYYISDTPFIVDTFGTTGRIEVMQALEAAAPEDVPALQRDFGRVWLDENSSQALTEFVRQSTRTAMRRGRDPLGPLRWLRAPYHFQSHVGPEAYQFEEEVLAVEIFRVTYLFTGGDIVLVDRQRVLEVDLDRPEPGQVGTP